MTLPLSLLALAIASFGIGTTEFVIMGLLPDVATDLGVSIPSAGLLIGGYALGVTFGTPVMAVLMANMPRKSALLVLVGIFTLGNLLCAMAPSYGLLMAARLLTALSHGTFFGLGSVAATTLVPPAQRSRAVAIMFSGLTLANILGVPAGAALGQWAGWRSAFLAIVPIGFAAGLAIWRWLPAAPPSAAISLVRQLRVMRNPAVLLPMMASTCVSACLFATFTYVAPILQTSAGMSPQGVTRVLLLFGIGITLGNLLGGRLADWRQLPTIMVAIAASVVLLLFLSAVVTSPLAASGTVFVWGLVHFAAGSPLQSRVVAAAHEAPGLAASFNQSAFNLGNALGAWIGAQALDLGFSYGTLPLISAVLALVALAITVADLMLNRRHQTSVCQTRAV